MTNLIRIRVLIADDEPELRESVRSALVLADEAEFQVDMVGDRDKVLEKLRQWKPQVLVLDDRFGPDEEDNVGISILLPQIRAEFENVGIVIITAHRGSSMHPVTQAGAYGADAFLDKPFTREKLIEAVLSAYQAYLKRGGSDD